MAYVEDVIYATVLITGEFEDVSSGADRNCFLLDVSMYAELNPAFSFTWKNQST